LSAPQPTRSVSMSTLLLTSLFTAETIASTLESSILVTSTIIRIIFVICKGFTFLTRVRLISRTIAPDERRLALISLICFRSGCEFKGVIVSHHLLSTSHCRF
jgi:hypothetical protein